MRVAAVVLGLAVATAAQAQDFDGPVSRLDGDGWLAMLERGFPPRNVTLGAEALTVRWHGLPDLTTRALAAGFAVRSLHVAVGAGQTGTPDVGWSTVAGAAGVRGAGGAAGVRVVARRDRTAPFAFDDHNARVGIEVGGGAAVPCGSGLVLWAVAPQLWLDGAAPPLARALELGGVFESGTAVLSLARRSTRGGGEHHAVLALDLGMAVLWVEARDRPVRPSVGVAVTAGPLGVRAVVGSHPVLGETVRLAVTLGARTPSFDPAPASNSGASP